MTGPVCDGVSPLRPLADPSVRSLAVVRMRTGLGDLLASVPALRAVRAARPDLHVTVISYPEAAAAVRRQAAYVDEFVAFPGHPGIPERPASPEPELACWFAAMRDRRFDLALQMYGALPAANAVTAQLGARLVGGFVTPGAWPAQFTTAQLDTFLPYPARAHEVDRHLRLVSFLGVAPGPRQLEFPLTPADQQQAERVLDGVSRPFAVVHPGATAPSRRWPANRFAAVADALADRGLAVVLTGVPSERGVVNQVQSSMRSGAHDLCGGTDLGGLAAVVDRAEVVVSNDTGIVQLAVARATPSVTVYLAGDANRWRGADLLRHRSVLVDVGCNPCGLLECPIDFRCAMRLPVDRVVSEVDAVLHASVQV